MRIHFPEFANFAGDFGPTGIPAARALIAFGNTPITKGAKIEISNTNIITGPHPMGTKTINFNVSVTVNSVSMTSGSSMGFSFSTNDGHVLHPAAIAFLATDLSSGRVGFSISVRGNFAGVGQRAGYYAGGSDLEDKIWNNVINNVRKYCGNP